MHTNGEEIQRFIAMSMLWNTHTQYRGMATLWPGFMKRFVESEEGRGKG